MLFAPYSKEVFFFIFKNEIVKKNKKYRKLYIEKERWNLANMHDV